MELRAENFPAVKERQHVKHPIRYTALVYLRDALQNESYEDCQDIIAIAYEFGANESEVQLLLEDPRRVPSP